MTLRDRLFLSTSAFLYLGPLFAGLSGAGFGTVPVFTALFLLWLHRVRPQDWPRVRADWAEPRQLAWLFLIVCGQALLVAFLLVMGAGLGMLSGDPPQVPLTLALAFSMLATAVANLLRQPGEPLPVWRPGMGMCIGAGVLWASVPGRPGHLGTDESGATARQALADLPARGATRAELAPVLAFARREGIEVDLLAALVAKGTGHLPHVQAAVALALTPEVARRVTGRGLIWQAAGAALASRVPALMQETAQGLERLAAAVPEAAVELPGRSRLLTSADEIETLDPFAARVVRALAQGQVPRRVA